jgi:hypothetical protein
LNSFQLQMLLMGYGVVTLIIGLTAIGMLLRSQVLTGRLMKELRTQRRQIGQILTEQAALSEAVHKQPNEIAEGARYLKKAADDIRWQSANKDIVLNDQLDLLLKQYRMLVSMQAGQVHATPAVCNDASAGHDSGLDEAGMGDPQTAPDYRAPRPRLVAGRPAKRNEHSQPYGATGSGRSAPVREADVVTLADHLSCRL